ncbi:MAG: DUF4386 family protein, partial [Anaerolineales bacterium]
KNRINCRSIVHNWDGSRHIEPCIYQFCSEYEPDYLTQVTTNPNQLVMGALFVLMMGLALAIVPVIMFPILKRYNEVLALGM